TAASNPSTRAWRCAGASGKWGWRRGRGFRSKTPTSFRAAESARLEGGQHVLRDAVRSHRCRVDQHPFGDALRAQPALAVLNPDIAVEARPLGVADPGAGRHARGVGGEGAQIIDLMPDADPRPASPGPGVETGVPVGCAGVLQPADIDDVVDVAVVIDVLGPDLEREDEDLPIGPWLELGPRHQASASPRDTPLSASRLCSSPALNISRTMSEPPTKSPFTYSCGMVGQSLKDLMPSRSASSCSTSTPTNGAPRWSRICTASEEKPQRGESGVLFMNRTTSCSFTVSVMKAWTG